MDPRDKKLSYDIEKIDFEWVESTNNVKELKKALQALVEDKGGYVQLEKAIQDKIEQLDPKSKKPENKISSEEMRVLEKDIESWTLRMDEQEKLMNNQNLDKFFNLEKSETAKQTGNDYLRSKEYDSAIEWYTKSISLNDKNSASYFNRSLAYIKTKLFQKAVDDCDKAIEISSDYTKAYHRRAVAFMQLKEYAKAIKDLELVMEKDPENESANADLKKCREEAGKIGNYKRIQIVEEDEESSEEKNEDQNEPEAKVWEIIEPEEKVMEIIEEPEIIVRPEVPSKISEAKGKVIETGFKEKVYEIVDPESPSDFLKKIEDIKTQGNVFFRQEDHDSAIQEFSRAISMIYSKHPDKNVGSDPALLSLLLILYNNRALCFSKLDLNNEAIKDSHKVLGYDPKNLKAMFRIGKCEASRNNFKEAVKYMRMILDIDPANVPAKTDFHDYCNKLAVSQSTEEDPNTPRKKFKLVHPTFKETVEVEEKNKKDEEKEGHIKPPVLERRVSFKSEDFTEHEKKMLAKHEIYKQSKDKYPKETLAGDEPTGGYVKSNEKIDEIEEKKIDFKGKQDEIDKIEIPTIKEKKKKAHIEISKETIDNAKEIASKLVSNFDVPKSVLMFETAAKALKNDKKLFYEYLKRINVEDIPVMFANSEFSVDLANQCIDCIIASDLDVNWASSFLKQLPKTNRFNTVIKLFSRSEKAKIKNLIERLGDEELSLEFKLN